MIAEVDSKLLKLAQVLGKVATNDYNLNKVAQVQGVGIKYKWTCKCYKTS